MIATIGASDLYWRLRNAIAPSKMASDNSLIRGVPGSCFSTLARNKYATIREMTPAANDTHAKALVGSLKFIGNPHSPLPCICLITWVS